MSHGGKRKGAGRKKGSINKRTEEMREVAQALAMENLERVGELIRKTENEATLVRSLVPLLTNGFGRPVQSVPFEQPATQRVRTYRWARTPEEAIFDPARGTEETK